VENKKPLISVRELKEYFPVRGRRGMFVKANDGVTLDIYEGETMGIVGESGCGKSTLGRVILQLLVQTEGETVYYGRTIDEVVPMYALDIFKNLERKCTQSKINMKKLEEMEAAFDALEKEIGDDKEDPGKRKLLYEKLNEKILYRRKVYSEFLSIVRLVGGMYGLDDYTEASRILMDFFKAALAERSINLGLANLRLKIAEAEYVANKNPSDANKAKVDTLQKKLDGIVSGDLKKADDLRLEKQEVINEFRAKYEKIPEYQKYDSYRDAGIDLARLTYSEMRLLRKDLQLIFQDPYSSLNPRLSVGQIISEGPIIHKDFAANNERMQEYTMKVLEECGLAGYMIHRYPHMFSGGQRQRIGIARALAMKPKFVVCDEAVSALDVSIQSQIINLLQELKEKENLTYMFISHDLSVVKNISDRIAVMYLGVIVELCGSAELFDNPLHPYTEALLSAIPTTDLDSKDKEMIILEGDIPSPVNPPPG